MFYVRAPATIYKPSSSSASTQVHVFLFQMSSKIHPPLGLQKRGVMLKTFSIGLVGIIDATNVDMNSIKWTEFTELKTMEGPYWYWVRGKDTKLY